MQDSPFFVDLQLSSLLPFFHPDHLPEIQSAHTLSQDSAEAPHEAYESHLSINEQLEDIMERYPSLNLALRMISSSIDSNLNTKDL